MADKQFQDLWHRLARRPTRGLHFLTAVSLNGIRGIDNLKVAFNYPVSVLAGENGSGKSTVISAAACAYKVPGAGTKEFVPSTLFPSYQPKSGRYGDSGSAATFEFEYLTPDGTRFMKLQCAGKKWNRSFLGRRGARQPERPVYLRPANPSGLQGVPGGSRSASEQQETSFTASQIQFTQPPLPFRHSRIAALSSGKGKHLLLVEQESGAVYSEFHMAAGERAILRMSKEIAEARGALILIDEVEAGLHPRAQKILMQELLQLALRNDLQIIVTTHSPVVLDSVPETGRIFLERDEGGRVVVRLPYPDLIQDALYGRLGETFNLLCEDEATQGILDGVLDFVIPRLPAKRESISIGCDTGVDRFPMYARMFQRFDQSEDFGLVLGGDRRDSDMEQRIQDATSRQTRVMFLPGAAGPEEWVWSRMRDVPEGAIGLGLGRDDLIEQMDRLDATYDVAVDSSSAIAKAKIGGLSEIANLGVPEICRMIARQEMEREKSALRPLVEQLENAFRAWHMKGHRSRDRH